MALTDQREFMKVDEFGFDPLLDESYDAIEGVTTYRAYTVKAAEEFNPGLIAFVMYRNIAWWRAILVYNGLEDIWDLKVGMEIRLPDINEMTTRLQRAKVANATNRVISI